MSTAPAVESRRGAFVPLVLLAALLLGGAVLWTYGPILDNGFVWDDGGNLGVARASWDRGLSGLAWAFREPFGGHYQPLTWASYQLDARISGATPRGVHATQLLLHLANTAAVAWLAWVLAACPPLRSIPTFSDRRGRALFAVLAAALFALHPIRVESVAWATERRDLLSTLFALSALALHLRASPSDASASSARGRVAFLHALSALSRAQMTLPFVLLLVDLWPLRRLANEPDHRTGFLSLVREKWLSFVIAAASAAAAVWAQASHGALTSATEHGALDRFVQAGYGLIFYPAALLFGSTFLPLYERPFPFDPTLPRYLGPALGALAVLAVIFWLRRRFPSTAVASGSYALLVLPVLGIAQSGIQLVADRYAYLATVPLVLLAAGALGRLWISSPRAVRLLLALGLAALLAGQAHATHRQTQIWQSDETLWRHVLDHSSSCLADNNLGYILYGRGESGPALFHLVRSLERVPSYGRPWRGIAALLEAPVASDGPPPLWVAETLEGAAATQADSVLPRYAAALGWMRAGDDGRAERELREVLTVEPDHEGARLALARIAARRDPANPVAPTITGPAFPAAPAPPGR
ncbi:MAG: hypothetical protein ABJC13_10585 [Acidobacteriota bacterium]